MRVMYRDSQWFWVSKVERFVRAAEFRLGNDLHAYASLGEDEPTLGLDPGFVRVQAELVWAESNRGRNSFDLEGEQQRNYLAGD